MSYQFTVVLCLKFNFKQKETVNIDFTQIKLISHSKFQFSLILAWFSYDIKE